MEYWEELLDILEQSVKKNGEIQLTNKHLLNIMKMAERRVERQGYLDNIRECEYEACRW